MIKKLSKFLIWITALIVGLYVITGITPLYFLNDQVKTILEKEAKKRNIIVDINDVKVAALRKINFKEVGIMGILNGLPIPFKFESLDLSLSFFPLLIGEANFTIDGTAYEGTLKAQKNISLLKGMHITSEGKIQNLNLSSYPLTSSMQISGILNMDIKTRAKGEKLNAIELKVQGNKLQYKGKYKIGGIIDIDNLKNGTLFLKVMINGKDLLIPDFKFSSEFGKVFARGMANLGPKNLPVNIDLTVDIELSELGIKTYGSYLALATNSTSTKPPHSKYKLKIDGLTIHRLATELVSN